MVATLAEKTTEALVEVAKINERISSQSMISSHPQGSSNSRFHLDVPKQPKGWKDTHTGRLKGDKKSRGGKSATTTIDTIEKTDLAHNTTEKASSSAKNRDLAEETHQSDQEENDSEFTANFETRRSDSGISAINEDATPVRRVSASPMQEISVSRTVGGGFSNRSTLRSRVSMSSIDLNDMTDVEASNSVIKLNVGGRHFCTTRSTLTSMPGTMFEALLSGRHAVIRDNDGAIFLDRDPDIFEHVLTYLRDPRQLDLRYFSQQQQMRILCEMDYFMVPFVRFSRDLPQNLTGHTILLERDNQWTMKWTNRGWWVGADHTGDSGASGLAQGGLGSASPIASTAHAGTGLPIPSASSSSALKAASFSSSSAAGSSSPPIEPPPGIKFVEDLVWVNMKGRPLRAYDVWTGQCLKIIKDSYCDCFAASSEHLVTYDADDQSLRLWNARTSSGLSWIKADVPPTNISCLAFVNETMLVLGGDGNKCVTLNLPAAPDLQATATTVLQGANLRQIEPLSPSVIAVGSTNGNIILWNIKLNVLLGTIPTAQQRISTIFARNNYVFCISPETIKVWDCFTNPSKPGCVAMIFDEVMCLDSDNDLIVGITADRSRKSLLKVWSLSSSKLVHVMAIPAGETVHTVRVQGNRIATVLEGGTVLTWTISLVN